jgi:hypothetical protein
MTAVYDHYAAIQKRMENLRAPINDMRNHLNTLERDEWIRAVETRAFAALAEAWPVLEELRKESNPVPEINSFIGSLKVTQKSFLTC